ncbi:type III-A CRISPR-associated protein Csm2 [Thermosyntropha sp.]|uniref:type III-A CRISPR-associated protein Csm2 n=1 Tax=Thermosyntropha sp. TaxID=2740820 RepID=UPI0025F23E95|nr:type III-A CRISPR-associated protein Csm2 [Thermosyntropha sp.]MBO8159671.1 type III-A CRISPR-associated protein Csm2 [Thermosyntropha sp.]
MTRTCQETPDLIEEAKRIVENMKNKKGEIKLTTSQIRKFLAAVTRLENKYELYKMGEITKNGKKPDLLPPHLVQEVQFLKVKLAYQAGRQGKNSKADIFLKDITPHIEKIGDKAAEFEKFCRLVEAIVAYHKYEGGKD